MMHCTNNFSCLSIEQPRYHPLFITDSTYLLGLHTKLADLLRNKQWVFEMLVDNLKLLCTRSASTSLHRSTHLLRWRDYGVISQGLVGQAAVDSCATWLPRGTTNHSNDRKIMPQPALYHEAVQ